MRVFLVENHSSIILNEGNKCDLASSREIPYHIGEAFAQRNNMKFIETSAKDSDNVERIFLSIAETLLKQANELYPNKQQGTIKPSNQNPNTTSIGSNYCGGCGS